jgi:hypothetical protein
VAKLLKLPLLTLDITAQMLYLTQQPQKGYGKYANPCIDCRANMLQIAYKVMLKYNADFIATGDVLNQHYISQTPESFRQQLKLANIPDLVCRPLCQKLLAKNLVDFSGQDWQGQKHSHQETFLKSNKINIYQFKTTSCKLLDQFFSRKVLILK